MSLIINTLAKHIVKRPNTYRRVLDFYDRWGYNYIVQCSDRPFVGDMFIRPTVIVMGKGLLSLAETVASPMMPVVGKRLAAFKTRWFRR